MPSVTWYLTVMTRPSGSTEDWTLATSGAGEIQSTEVLVFFGTEAEYDALTTGQQDQFDLVIIDLDPPPANQTFDDQVGAEELRTALNQALLDGTLPPALAPSNNSGYLGTSDADYQGQGLQDSAAYSLSGQSGIESATGAVLITLDPPTDATITAVPGFKGGQGNFNPFFPGSLGPNPICFVTGTLIETVDGPRAVETLEPGDLVVTSDHGPLPLHLSLFSSLTARDLQRRPELRPIRISAGALGSGLPKRDLLVSPQHRILVRSKIAQRMFGADEVLVAAKQLLQLDGIDIAHDLDEFRYYHLVFDRHEIVISNGVQSESLYPGPEALRSIGKVARDEIYALFPHLRDIDPGAVTAARILASGRQARKLAHRHLQNHKPLLG